MKKGFTLIELMIVVSILGIMAALAMPQFQDHIQHTRETAARNSLQIMRNQIELYRLQHGGLVPGYIDTIAATPTMLSYQLTGTSKISGYATPSRTPTPDYPLGPYLSSIPVNPFNGSAAIKIVAGSVTDFGTAVDTTSGWLYQRETATIKLNRAGTDSQGQKYLDY